jgi:hypothetical protein
MPRRAAPQSQPLTAVPHRVDDLQLDVKNPRLQDVGLGPKSTQDDILKALWDKMAVDEVALSIANNGFYQHEPLFAAKEDGKLVVIEGNRRLAAVRLLRDPALRQKIGASGLPPLTKDAVTALDTLPVVVAARKDVWTYLGFKHINGPQTWESYSKAHYIAWVHNHLKVSLSDIATHIGDKHSTVVRLYDGLMALEQAEKAEVFKREDRFKPHFAFSHLYTGLGYPTLRKFLGLPPGERDLGTEPVPARNVKQLGELLRWLYGSKSENVPPVVKSQNPDLRQLDEVLGNERGAIALRKGLPLEVSLEISKGDERVFREALITAKQSLQKARGTVLSGYSGNEDLHDLAKEISLLATTLVEDMASRPTITRKSQRKG